MSAISSPSRIYFDNSATTPVDPRVAEAMQPFQRGICGNPSSMYSEGREAHQAVESAREQVALLLNANPCEVVFTACGTESDNTALGIVELFEGKLHIVTSAFEHPAIMETCRHLTRRGIAVTHVMPDSDGIVQPEALAKALRPETRLVSIMAAQNVVAPFNPLRILRVSPVTTARYSIPMRCKRSASCRLICSATGSISCPYRLTS